MIYWSLFTFGVFCFFTRATHRNLRDVLDFFFLFSALKLKMCIKTGGLSDKETDRRSKKKKKHKESRRKREQSEVSDQNNALRTQACLTWTDLSQHTHTFCQTPALANSLVCRCNTGRCSQPWKSFPLCPKTPFIQLGQQMKGIMGVNSERNVLTWHGVAWQLGRRLFKCRSRTESVIGATSNWSVSSSQIWIAICKTFWASFHFDISQILGLPLLRRQMGGGLMCERLNPNQEYSR